MAAAPSSPSTSKSLPQSDDTSPVDAAAADRRHLDTALTLAREAASAGDVPVGAIVVRSDGTIVGRGANRTLRDQDPTAHAEIIAIREASHALGRWRLDDCTLYVTLEPCAMCAGAIVLARTARVVFGAWDPKAGMGGSVGDVLRHSRLNHRPEVRGGVGEKECGEVLRAFFARRRADFSGEGA